MKALSPILAAFVVAALLAPSALAIPIRVNQIPNGNVISCSACHVNPGGGGTRNAFGQTVERAFLSGGNVVWGPLLASLDSDGDGLTNGEELQDPFGQWTVGQPSPGTPALVTRPGSAAENMLRTLAVQFQGMQPHVGQELNLCMVDEATGKERARATLPAIEGPDFEISFDAAAPGGSYRVDFFADHNGNGLYDAPPADHAWRLTADGVANDTALSFAHNTNFTDIKWPYAVTVNLHGMMPHLNRLLEARVVESTTGMEKGRARVEAISANDFSLVIPGLMANGSYNLDFYADANNNGRYNGTPSDHAWRVAFTNPEGDATVEFTHNTTFTDVQWPYQFTLHLLGMNPHVGQLLEMRVVEEASGNEVGRISLNTLSTTTASLSVPGIIANTNYRADFYADFNQNGQYDAPPTDHAWRVPFNSGTAGNVVMSFTHHTTFTDIAWPALGVEPLPEGVLPEAFALYQNYPNPFNPTTTIAFDLAAASAATLQVFDLMGREVATLVNAPLMAGRHTVQWQAEGVPSGVYFYRLNAGSYTATKRLLLMK